MRVTPLAGSCTIAINLHEGTFLRDMHTYPRVSTRIRNFFFADSASVHTYPVYPAYDSATFWIRFPDPKRGNILIRYESGIVWYFFIRWHQKIEPSSLPWIFKTVPSAIMISLLYLLDLSFKSYNVCAVKPTFLSFFPCRTDELGAVNKLNERNSAWWDNFVSETVTEESWR